MEVRVVGLGDRAILVTVTGGVGMREGEELRTAMAAAAGSPVDRIVADLTDAHVSDSGGLSALYDAAIVLRPRGGVVAVVAPATATVRRVVQASGLDAAFALYDTRDAALDDLGLHHPGPGSGPLRLA